MDTKKPVTGRGSTTKRSRAAEVHNQSERVSRRFEYSVHILESFNGERTKYYCLCPLKLEEVKLLVDVSSFDMWFVIAAAKRQNQ